MHFCYVDEAGCTGSLMSSASNVQPVLALAGVIIPQDRVASLTKGFLALKREMFPRLLPATTHQLDWIRAEIKGSDVRGPLTGASRDKRRHALGVLGKTIQLMEDHDCRLVGRVWVKGVGQTVNGQAIYTSSIQYIHTWFQKYLEKKTERGIVVCDHRNKGLNTGVSHSIFTERYRQAGDKYPMVGEMPLFGHSDNHAGLQVADIVASGLLFPMAIDAYCRGHLTGTHTRAGYGVLRDRLGGRLEALQDRELEILRVPPRRIGGITVDDQIGQKSRTAMFKL